MHLFSENIFHFKIMSLTYSSLRIRASPSVAFFDLRSLSGGGLSPCSKVRRCKDTIIYPVFNALVC
jgi:hypothetical protein